MDAQDFRKQICSLMEQVPSGRVTTYGDLAALAGHPYASRVVGGIAHHDAGKRAWHRLVNRHGGLATGFPGGREQQKILLESEGVVCEHDIVRDFKEKRWSLSR